MHILEEKMKKFPPIALVAILACGLAMPAVHAQSTAPGGTPTTPPPTTPTPTTPVPEGDPDISTLPGPVDPDVTTTSSSSTNSNASSYNNPANGRPGGVSNLECGAKLAQLRRVRASALQAVTSEYGILVQPVCDSRSLVGDQRDNKNLDAGNSRDLITIIARNKPMSGALADRGYNPDHVVGIILTRGQVTLYVNKLRHQS